jgi:hypothetical protein
MEIEEDVNYVYAHRKDYLKNIDLLRIKDVVKVDKASMKSSVNLIVCEQVWTWECVNRTVCYLSY